MLTGPAGRRLLAPATVVRRPPAPGGASVLRPRGDALPASLPDLSIYPSVLTVSITVGRVSAG